MDGQVSESGCNNNNIVSDGVNDTKNYDNGSHK